MNSEIANGMSMKEAINEAHKLGGCLAALTALKATEFFRNDIGTQPRKFVGTYPILGTVGSLINLVLRFPKANSLKLVRRLNDGLKNVISEILKEENHTGPNDNFLTLVILGSALLDKFLVEIVAEPAREFADAIIESHLKRNRNYNVQALEGWRDGKVPASLGIVVMILSGLRRGLKQGRELIRSYIQKNFLPAYEECIMDVRMINAVDYVRSQYRNPACHLNRGFFNYNEYKDLSIIIVGNPSFNEWLKESLYSKKEPDKAIFHNHLVLHKIQQTDHSILAN
jgi:hypothetical protein